MENEMMNSVMAELEPQLREVLKQAVIDRLKWDAQHCIEGAVTKWLGENVAQVVIEHLTENKGAIVQASVEAADAIATELRNMMVKQAVEQINRGYQQQQIIKQLFGL